MKSRRKGSEERCLPSTLMRRGTSGKILTAAFRNESAKSERENWVYVHTHTEQTACVSSFIFFLYPVADLSLINSVYILNELDVLTLGKTLIGQSHLS